MNTSAEENPIVVPDAVQELSKQLYSAYLLLQDALPLALERLAGKTEPVSLWDQKLFWEKFASFDHTTDYDYLEYLMDDLCDADAWDQRIEELFLQSGLQSRR